MEEVREARSPVDGPDAGIPPWLERVRREVVERARERRPGDGPPGGHGAALSDSHRAGPLRCIDTYGSVRAGILQPDRAAVVVTRYFLEQWAPRLGPTLTMLVLRLRAIAAEHRAAREALEGRIQGSGGAGAPLRPVFPTQAELAAQIGVSEATIHRELKHPLAHYFVKRVGRYEQDPRTGKRVRGSDVYEIAMDDPPTPEDERELAYRAAQRVMDAAAASPGRQIDGQVNAASSRATSVRYREMAVLGPNRQPDGQVRALTSCLNVNEIPIGISNVNAASEFCDCPADSERAKQARALADQLVEELEDPTSRPFYLRVAWRCPADIVWAALSETKDNHLTGRIRRSRGACFTDRIRRMARARGVGL